VDSTVFTEGVGGGIVHVMKVSTLIMK